MNHIFYTRENSGKKKENLQITFLKETLFLFVIVTIMAATTENSYYISSFIVGEVEMSRTIIFPAGTALWT